MTLVRKSLCSLALGVLAFAPLLSGCGGSAVSGDEAMAADSTQTADQVSAVTSLTTDGVDLTTSGISSDTAATVAASSAGSKLTPATCLTKSVVGSVATYTMNSCTGPYGLVAVTGTLQATYTVQGSGTGTSLKVDLAATGLKVNGATLDIASSATISGPQTARTATVTSTTRAVTARGNSIAHTGSYTAGSDGNCVTLTGSFATQSGIFNWSTQIDNYKRCQNMCPTQGKITFTGTLHTTTITYNGSATAAITVDGRTGNLGLLCSG